MELSARPRAAWWPFCRLCARKADSLLRAWADDPHPKVSLERPVTGGYASMRL